MIQYEACLPVHSERKETPAALRLLAAIPPPLATAVGISILAHMAVYGLTPVLSLHVVALGGSATQVGVLFSVFALVAVVLRPLAGVWIDRHGIRPALLTGAALVVLSSLALQAAGAPEALIALMAGFGVGFGLTTMAAAVLAATAPAEHRASALSVYYLAAPVSMALAAPLGLWLFRSVGAGANFAAVTLLGMATAAFSLWSHVGARRTGPVTRPVTLWSRGAAPLSVVLAVAAMGQSSLYAFVPLHATSHGQAAYLPWFFGIYSTGMIVFRVGVSRVADRWGRRLVLVPALVLLAAGFGVLSATPTPPRLTLAAVLLAAGSAAVYPTIMTLVVDRVPDRERGVAMGMVAGAWDLGAFVGALLIAGVVEHASHGAGFLTAAALLIAALGGFGLVERRRTRNSQGDRQRAVSAPRTEA
ncbi:MAG TPA: MFS transporter [Vicinamibacterales bacterium]|nr:MFS transporter [Vicinamibacterales bacterium]